MPSLHCCCYLWLCQWWWWLLRCLLSWGWSCRTPPRQSQAEGPGPALSRGAFAQQTARLSSRSLARHLQDGRVSTPAHR